MASLLVVNSEDVGPTYAAEFRRLGIAADCVRTPEEALAYIAEHLPAVIVTENLFRLSGYDGPRFIRSVRKRPDCARTKIIVVSAHGRPEQREQARLAGADLFVSKTELAALPAQVNRALSVYRRGAYPRSRDPRSGRSSRSLSGRSRPRGHF